MKLQAQFEKINNFIISHCAKLKVGMQAIRQAMSCFHLVQDGLYLLLQHTFNAVER
jgi:hypothetical protein